MITVFKQNELQTRFNHKMGEKSQKYDIHPTFTPSTQEWLLICAWSHYSSLAKVIESLLIDVNKINLWDCEEKYLDELRDLVLKKEQELMK